MDVLSYTTILLFSYKKCGLFLFVLDLMQQTHTHPHTFLRTTDIKAAISDAEESVGLWRRRAVRSEGKKKSKITV